MSSQKKRCTDTDADASSGKKLSLSNPSNAPCHAATNEGGYGIFNDKSRSLLCHPFGVPLATACHRQCLPSCMKSLVNDYPENIATTTRGNQILSQVYEVGMDETELTSRLSKKIAKTFGGDFSVLHQTKVNDESDQSKSFGRLDIVFHDIGYTHKNKNKIKIKNTNESTPVAILEFGRGSADWWKKFHQGVLYLNLMRNTSNKNMRFQKPMLMVIVTIDDNSGDFFRIGVFLCTRKNLENKDYDFRISLIWQQQDNDLVSASKSFGSLLRISSLFQAWSAKHESQKKRFDYEYLSSNCCRLGSKVSDKFMAHFPSSTFCICILNVACLPRVGGPLLLLS